MARPLRIQYHGAWYHVMNRGANHRQIFKTHYCYKRFFKLLSETCKMWQLEVHAHCLMPNHYHLVLRTPLANLSRCMQHIDGVYTQMFNHRWKRDGQLFRGRYKSIIVEEGDYLRELIRYVHMNPVEAKLCNDPSEYKFSSHPIYMGLTPKPIFLKTNFYLSQFGNTPKVAQKELNKFIISKNMNDLGKQIDGKKSPSILGSDKFKEWIKFNFKKKPKNNNFLPFEKDIRLSINEIITIIKKLSGQSWLVIKGSKSRTLAKYRHMAIYAARIELGMSHKRICRLVGKIRPSQISNIISSKYDGDKLWQKFLRELDSIKMKNEVLKKHE